MTFSPKASPAVRQKAVAGLIAQLNADRHPILLGPWRSEVGFECMYWIPFLTFLASKVMKFDKRASIVTRGGLAPLYRNVAAQGYDLYALRSVDEVRRENLFDAQVRQKGKTIKQLQATDWDEAVVADAAKALNLSLPYHVVHPAWMYWALDPFWSEQAGFAYLSTITDYRALPRPELAKAPQLPEKFVAVKCYQRATFPYPEPTVANWTRETVAVLAAQTPVVLLNTGSEHDDHIDVPMSGANIYVLPKVAPEHNLLVQAAVLAKATAFVGTYGGVAQLALRMGIPSVSAWLEFGGTCHAHLSLSSWLSKAMKVPFVAGAISDYGLVKQIVALPGKVELAA